MHSELLLTVLSISFHIFSLSLSFANYNFFVTFLWTPKPCTHRHRRQDAFADIQFIHREQNKIKTQITKKKNVSIRKQKCFDGILINVERYKFHSVLFHWTLLSVISSRWDSKALRCVDQQRNRIEINVIVVYTKKKQPH